VLVGAAMLIFCVSPLVGQSRKSKPIAEEADRTVVVPAFSISVKLSDEAQKRIQQIHESVLVIAYFDGDALPGYEKDNAPFRDVFLGSDEKLVDANYVATFADTKVSQRNWNHLSDKNYFLTINVVSARRA
jgi:hypothetical protein